MRYSEADLLAEIDALADELGHPPTLAELRQYGDISATTYYNRFGSWQNALQEAGYEPRQPTGKLSEEVLLDELERLANQLENPPSAAQMDDHGEYWSSTYRNRFGSWNNALRAAGLDTDPPSTPVDEEALVVELKRVAEELGEPPTFEQMSDHGEYPPRTFVRHFGTWNEAVATAGFEPSTIGSDITDGELLLEIERLADELGKQPSARDMDEHGNFASATYQRHFGSWSAAVKSALDDLG